MIEAVKEEQRRPCFANFFFISCIQEAVTAPKKMQFQPPIVPGTNFTSLTKRKLYLQRVAEQTLHFHHLKLLACACWKTLHSGHIT